MTGDCSCGIEERRKQEAFDENVIVPPITIPTRSEILGIDDDSLQFIKEQVGEGFTSGKFTNQAGHNISWDLKIDVWKD